MTDFLADMDILKNLLASRAVMASQLLSEKLGISARGTKATPKESAKDYLAIRYSSTLEKYGWRQLELLISTGGGKSMAIGKDLLKRDKVAYVARTIGQYNIDLRAEVFVNSSEELVNLIEDVKAMNGVKDVIWSEAIEVVGRKNHIPAEIVAVLKKKAAIKKIR
jgi:hypothetical protein